MLTGVVLTHNEQDDLDRCLDALKFCDEILVVDDNSTDKTLEITKKYKARWPAGRLSYYPFWLSVPPVSSGIAFWLPA